MSSDVKRKPGRPLGSKSADSIEYQAYLIKQKFNIPDQELWCLEEARKQYEFYKKKLQSGQFSPMEDHAAKYLKIYQEMLKEMASRVYPKLKSIVQTTIIEEQPRPLRELSDDVLDKL